MLIVAANSLDGGWVLRMLNLGLFWESISDVIAVMTQMVNPLADKPST